MFAVQEGCRSPARHSTKQARWIDELGTGWSRFSVDLIPSTARAIFSRGFDPNIDYYCAEIENSSTAGWVSNACRMFSISARS